LKERNKLKGDDKDMASNKKTSKKTAVKKTAAKKTEVKVEETPVKEAQTYMCNLFIKQEPVDVPLGGIMYHKQSGTFELHCENPRYEADLENVIKSDLTYNEDGKLFVVSRSQSPISWIINLHKSNELDFFRFKASEAREIYEA